MTTLNIIFAVLCTAFYLQIGHMNWILMLITDPQGKDCPLANDIANFDQLPPAARMSLRLIRALYIAGWPVFFVISDYKRFMQSRLK